MKVCVLMGGISEEREISIKSGKAVVNALKASGIDVLGLDVQGKENWLEQHLPDANVYFIALHGSFGEDGQIQSFLQSKGLAYTGSSPEASKIAMDKCLSKMKFQANNIPVPKGICIKKNTTATSLAGLNPPIVIKPSASGSSFGLSIVSSAEEAASAINKAFVFSETVIAEEFISGREITIGILGDKALTPIEIKPIGNLCFDHASKYTKGKTEYILPAGILEEEAQLAKKIALKAFNCIGCTGFGRVDIILGRDSSIKVLEINTIPGMTDLSLLPMAAGYEGIDFKGLCLDIIKQARSDC